MGILTQKDGTHLEFIYHRLINIHDENEHGDYMINFKSIIDKLNTPPQRCKRFNHTAPTRIRTEIDIKTVSAHYYPEYFKRTFLWFGKWVPMSTYRGSLEAFPYITYSTPCRIIEEFKQGKFVN